MTISTSMKMASSFFRLAGGLQPGEELLFMGLWAVAGQSEPDAIPEEEDATTYLPHLTTFDGGIIRTSGRIGEWYTDLPSAIKEPVAMSPSSLGDADGGIIRTSGRIGEWYTVLPHQYYRTPYPGYSYMDTVLAEL